MRQRYILAVLYYSTNGENWKNQYRFLIEGVHECNWHVNDEGKSGIYCTEQGEITLINFCEYCFTVYAAVYLAEIWTDKDVCYL